MTATYVCHICRMIGPLTEVQVKAHEIVHGHRVERVSMGRMGGGGIRRITIYDEKGKPAVLMDRASHDRRGH